MKSALPVIFQHANMYVHHQTSHEAMLGKKCRSTSHKPTGNTRICHRGTLALWSLLSPSNPLITSYAGSPNRYSWCHNCWITLIMFLYIAVSDETLA